MGSFPFLDGIVLAQESGYEWLLPAILMCAWDVVGST